MIICTAERHTSQGHAPCHQPESHDGDHLAVFEDDDGILWVASWYGDLRHIDLTPLPSFNDETTGLAA